ncbi:unnamed protein product [Miscanthus lutarioriparius]|uniref:Uncharacterized protein n=1 Tax=Miscanthus lutarioriparius TaxID=422564 RepID=A0A811NB38_9POAL|nr:unnamed protein product [Miscanthus lutarioriparius]
MEEDQKNELLSAAKLRTGVSPEKDWSSSLGLIFVLQVLLSSFSCSLVSFAASGGARDQIREALLSCVLDRCRVVGRSVEPRNRSLSSHTPTTQGGQQQQLLPCSSASRMSQDAVGLGASGAAGGASGDGNAGGVGGGGRRSGGDNASAGGGDAISAGGGGTTGAGGGNCCWGGGSTGTGSGDRGVSGTGIGCEGGGGGQVAASGEGKVGFCAGVGGGRAAVAAAAAAGCWTAGSVSGRTGWHASAAAHADEAELELDLAAARWRTARKARTTPTTARAAKRARKILVALPT